MDRPNVRRAITVTMLVDGREFDITFGRDMMTGRIFEIFFSGMKEGSTMQGMLTTICVMVSRALQRGDTPAQIMDGTIGVMSFPPNGPLFLVDGNEQRKIGDAISIPYVIVKSVEWAAAGFPEDFRWS